MFPPARKIVANRTDIFFHIIPLSTVFAAKNLYFASGYEGDKPAAPGVNLTNYSSRFEGEFIAPATGEVIFSINADDGHWFYIDGKCVSENEQWTNGYITCKLDAVKGQKYRLKLEHRQSKGRAMISLRANMKM